MKQRAGDLQDLESKGTAYFDANKDIFASCVQLELNIGAAANRQGKQQHGKFKSKRTSFNRRIID